MFEQIINLIAVHECLSCGAEGALLCEGCSRVLPPGVIRNHDHSALDQLMAATSYEGVAKEILFKLKFGRAKDASRTIARVMALRLDIGETLIVPVPTATSRVRSRGYDQSVLIAHQLARLTGNPTTSLLARLGQQRQLGQNRTLRNLQLQSSFRLKSAHMVRNQSILLVDDVFTTGATLGAAANILRQGGARSIRAAVFAMV